MKIAIIEDEKITAKDLANTIKVIEPDAEIVAILGSVEDAILFFGQNPDLDLIFSDIELGDGLCFDIFEQVENHTPIIFCTAYEKYSLDAFRNAGIDYILKPFNKLSIERTLLKYKSLKAKLSKSRSDLDGLLSELKGRLFNSTPSIIVHQADKIIPISGNDIALFYIDSLNTIAYTFNHSKYIVPQKMEALESLFAPYFFRANRQHLVNRKAIKDASQYFNRKLIINLTIAFSEQIVVGKLKTAEFLKWLTGY